MQKSAGLLEALEPLATAHNVEIVTVEVVGSRKAPTIRVYLVAMAESVLMSLRPRKNGLTN